VAELVGMLREQFVLDDVGRYGVAPGNGNFTAACGAILETLMKTFE
jgi:hypothetical protein